MYLLCELIGFCGNKKIKEFRKGLEKSTIKWKAKFLDVPRPSNKSLTIWAEFLNWLSTQTIIIVNDFDTQIEYKYQIAQDGKYLKEESDKTRYYKRAIK